MKKMNRQLQEYQQATFQRGGVLVPGSTRGHQSKVSRVGLLPLIWATTERPIDDAALIPVLGSVVALEGRHAAPGNSISDKFRFDRPG